jgi:thiol-disulfide isomerase/thioredoxin
MTLRFFLPVVGTVVLATAIAQTNPQPQPDNKQPQPDNKPPAARETPPDIKAYTEAGKLTDPDQKIAAYEKLKKDFPESSMLSSADSAILSTLLKSKPDQKERIRKLANSIYKDAEAKDKKASKGNVIVTTRNRESAAARIADQFLTAGILLKEGESYAKRSIDPMRQAVWISEQREAYTKRKQPIPPSEELTKRFNEDRASRLATLGRIELKLGREVLGKKLLEESYAVTPGNVTVAGALGEMAAKAGDDSKALDYLIPVRLSGRASESATAAFDSLYKKSHNGSLDGMEATLDTEYHKRFPNPVHVEAYAPTEKRTSRVVLGEVFTGSGCPPCAAADLAFDAAMERYARKDVAVVMYHQHIPRPDPMTTTETTARAKFYAVRGVPTFAIDGKDTIGGGARDYTKKVYDGIEKDIQKELETDAEARIKVDAALNGGTVRATAAVDQLKSESKDLQVQILLVEKELRYSGENGVRFHPMVVRAFGGEKGEGYKLDGSGSFEAAFDVDAVSKAIKAHLDDYEAKGHRGESFKFAEKKYQINRNNLAVVAFVQDTKSHHILQAVWVDLGTAGGAHPTTESNGINDDKAK